MKKHRIKSRVIVASSNIFRKGIYLIVPENEPKPRFTLNPIYNDN